MGCCCSSDYTPDVPDVIQDAPGEEEETSIVISQLGVFGSRDYGIWKGKEVPKSSEDRKQKMWMWLNKSSDPNDSNKGIIDVEDFVRDPSNKMNQGSDKADRGRILWSATLTEKPYFEQQQRMTNDKAKSGFMRFMGNLSTIDNGYDSYDDDHYGSHPRYKRARSHTEHHGDTKIVHKKIGGDMISKWQMRTKVEIKRGEMGRGEGTFLGNDPLWLEIFSKGTGYTTWEQVDKYTKDEDGHTHHSKHIEKLEDEFVDRIEYRLVFNGMIWAMWSVDGDSRQYNYRFPNPDSLNLSLTPTLSLSPSLSLCLTLTPNP